MTIKEIRKAMRELNKDGGSVSEAILIPGWGQIRKIGQRSDGYAIGPLPEDDHSDPMTDYTDWSYCWKEKWVLDRIAEQLHIA